jgi:prevent-host-death family protein
MKTYSTCKARNKFAELIDESRREPVAIERHGRVVAVMLAKEDFDYYNQLDDEKWMNYTTVPAENMTQEINARIEKLEKKLIS